jgi:protease secretion system membrane fusion protein
VITEILVREGSRVKQGQVLLRINPLESEANLSAASSEYVKLLAMASRLEAERRGTEIIWEDDLVKLGDSAGVTEAKLLQTQIFRSRRSEFDSQRRTLDTTISSLNLILQEKRGQLSLVAQEAASVIQLAKEGFVPEARANEMRRAQSNLESEVARLRADLNAAQQQLLQLRSNRLKEIDTELSEIQRVREGLQIKVQSLDFQRNLSEVKAPVAGVIVGMTVNTVGGVIGSGVVLMEVVPEDASLIVEAKVPTNLIDKVRVGLETDMRFSAFNQNTTPVIPGSVELVGADKLADPNTGDYYLARIQATAEGKALLKDKQIQPGMPVEVVVKTGERTFITYLTKPLSDRMARSFKD